MGPGEVRRLRYAGWRLLPGAAVPTGPGGPACAQIPVRAGRISLADPSLLRRAHRLGLPVHVWTVNDRAEMQRLLDLGIDGLISDETTVLRDVMAARGGWPA
jgi:glycerophosphoryl diester phosphodiesterase